MNKLLLILFFLVAGAAADNKVYICTGDWSECYHRTPDCEGLKYCSKEIKQVTLKEAQELKRKPCKYCYGHHK